VSSSSTRGAGRARAREEPSRPPTPEPAPAPADATPFDWPPSEDDLSAFAVLELTDQATGQLPNGANARPATNAGAIEGRTASRALRARRRHASIAVGVGLVAAAAIIGAGVAWFGGPPHPARQPAAVARSVAGNPHAGSGAAPAPAASETLTVTYLPSSTPRGVATNAPVSDTNELPAAPLEAAAASSSLEAPLISNQANPDGARLGVPRELFIGEKAPLPTSAPIVEPARMTAAPVAAAGHVAESSATLRDHNAIEQVLARYRQAYDARDVAAASAIWPSVDAPALARAFASIREQNMVFDGCELSIDADTATAECPGSLTFVRRVGPASPEVRRLSWTIDLRRAADRWNITRVAAR
jgi:hypothetical protein